MGARKVSTIWVCLCSLVVVWRGLSLAAYANTGDVVVVNVGVIVDPSTRIGREQKIGMEIASQDFNKVSKNFKLFLHFGFSSSKDPLQAAYSAMELVKEKRVEAIIIGSETWEEATLVAEIGNESKVPILALVEAPSYTLPLSTVGSQFLVKISNNHIYTTQIMCIASLVKYHQWKRVIVVYEDDGYDSGTSLMMDRLSKALQDVGSQIEFRLVLPPMGLRTDAKEIITQELVKTYDAVVGDVTILASRSKHVEFTQPFTTSGLSVIVPLTSMESQKAWMFMKPFSWQMWLASIGTLFYTMVIVWFLERRNNPDFSGSWNTQLSTALWFTFTSIFFAHREKLTRNFTRLTVVVWLFVVFVLTSSYTASLTSMLTVPLLEMKVKDIKRLPNSTAMVGCDGDSFVREYLVSVLGFKPDNILNINSEYSYSDLFANSTIVAAFIERPYATVFLHQYCKSFTKTKDHFRFAGQGFVFQKGSPLAADVSKAILKLSENGVLKQLNDKWFTPSLECLSSSKSGNDVERLNIQGFGVLYLFSGAISTSCFLLFIVRLLKSYRRHCQGYVITAEDRSVWNRLMRLAQYFDKGDQSQTPISERHLAVSDEPPSDDWVNVVRWDDDPTSDQTPEHNMIPLSLELLEI